MKRLLALSLLATLCAAQDGASELFYKAFWLEQAGGRVTKAEALYAELLAKHPKAAEAPRALLGVVRIRAAQGKDVAELVAKLRADYPHAKDELASAEKLAATFKREFDPAPERGDPPAVRKIKGLYMSAWTDADVDFLVDAGALAHPMLRDLLRSTDAKAARAAAHVLARQRSDAADAILAQALADPAVLFPGVVVAQTSRLAQPVLLDAAAMLQQRAGPRLRGEIGEAAGVLARTAAGDSGAWSLFTRALRDDDADVRKSALSTWSNIYQSLPDDTIRALLACAARGDRPLELANLSLWADRPALRDDVEATLLKVGPELKKLAEPHESATMTMLARVVLARRARFREELGLRDSTLRIASQLASWSDAAARIMLLDDRTADDSYLTLGIARAYSGRDGKVAEKALGPETSAKLRARIVTGLYAGGAHENAARNLWSVLGLDGRHVELVLREARRHGRGLPKEFVDQYVLRLEAREALPLLEVMTDAECERVLRDGRRPWETRDGLKPGVADFFAACIARVGPDSAATLMKLARHDEMYPAIVKRLLRAREAAWGWNAPLRRDLTAWGARDELVVNFDARRHVGPWLWHEVAAPDASLLPYVDDARREIARTAVASAASVAGDAGRSALTKALRSPHLVVRGKALVELARRPGGAEVVRSLRKDTSLGSYLLEALTVLPVADATPLLEQLLAEGQALAWRVLRERDPDVAVDRALAAVRSDRPAAFRDAALRVLTAVDDKRRIGVFRDVLTGELEGDLYRVLQTVGQQYLVELGPETLQQLRNPDARIRKAATQAVENLKFFAEAQKTFRDR